MHILKNIQFFVFFATMLCITGCSFMKGNNYEQQLKSPCAGVDGSPCTHEPVNTWLDNEYFYKVYHKEKYKDIV